MVHKSEVIKVKDGSTSTRTTWAIVKERPVLPLPTIMLAINSSGIISSVDLILTISYTCLRESCSSDLITPVPFSMPTVFLRNMKAGGLSGSDHLSFEPGMRNDIFIQFRGTDNGHGHFLHDVELLDEVGLEDPRNQIIMR